MDGWEAIGNRTCIRQVMLKLSDWLRVAALLIAWSDIRHSEIEGLVEVRDHVFEVTAAHIARWREDPDGRFRLKPGAEPPANATLEKFFPSL